MPMNPLIWRIDAAGATDARPSGGVSLSPASLLIEGLSPPWRGRLLALGDPGQIDRRPAAAGARRLAVPASVILPALVNAHTHLDLTHIGPRPYVGADGFTGWAMMVRDRRAATVDAAVASIRDGVRRSLAGGVTAVGDIIGRTAPKPADARDARTEGRRWLDRHSGLVGVGFAEVFGVGGWQDAAEADVRRLLAEGGDDDLVRLGVQPHAPYSAGTRLYRFCATGFPCRLPGAHGGPGGHGHPEDGKPVARGTPLIATHLAETLDEREFVQRGTGPFRDLLRSIGRWDDAAAAEVGHGLHPIEHVLSAIDGTGTKLLAAHVNDCPSELIPRLAAAGVSVAYCPRAHAYFGHEAALGPHRYREMLEAGVNLCLGTDSIINVPPQQADRLSVLDDMRLLFARDATDARTLLAMGTTHGARALGLDPGLFTLRAGGEIAGLVAVDVGGTPEQLAPLERALIARGAPRLLRLTDGAAP